MTEGRSSAGWRAPRRTATTVALIGLGTVGLLTVVVSALEQWVLAVTGLVVLQLGTALAVLGPWGARRGSQAEVATSKPSPKAADGIRDLERRVDALGARLVASTERTRVELLDALQSRTTDVPDDGPR